MTPAVLDSSLIPGWCFADRASAEGDQMLDYVRDFGAIVPGLWFLEVANIMAQAQKRNKIYLYDAAMRLEYIAALPIAVDQNTTGRAWTEILDLARTEGLSAYDATYLDLAMRRHLPLFTHNRALKTAAERCHVRHVLN